MQHFMLVITEIKHTLEKNPLFKKKKNLSHKLQCNWTPCSSIPANSEKDYLMETFRVQSSRRGKKEKKGNNEAI